MGDLPDGITRWGIDGALELLYGHERIVTLS
jgi:hypothetical protein